MKSGNLEMEKLVSTGVPKTLKYFRSVFASRMLDERTLKKHQDAFMEFVKVVGEYVKGEVWLNIIEITRAAGLNEFKEEVVRPKINEIFQMKELSLETLPLVKKKLELTPEQINVGEDSYRNAHQRKSTFQKRMSKSSKKLRGEKVLEPEVVSQE